MNGKQPQDYPTPEPWMCRAANEIDIKLGLPRFDQAHDWCARIIAWHYQAHLAAPVQRRPRTILPDFKALMEKESGADVLKGLEEDRTDPPQL